MRSTMRSDSARLSGAGKCSMTTGSALSAAKGSRSASRHARRRRRLGCRSSKAGRGPGAAERSVTVEASGSLMDGMDAGRGQRSERTRATSMSKAGTFIPPWGTITSA